MSYMRPLHRLPLSGVAIPMMTCSMRRVVSAAQDLVTFDRDLLDSHLINALETEGVTVASLATFLHALRARGIVTGDMVMPKMQACLRNTAKAEPLMQLQRQMQRE